MTLITARRDIRYTTQVYALSGPPWFIFYRTHRCTITTIPPLLIQCLSSNAKRNPKTPCTFLLSIFTWRSWKTKTTRNYNFKKWGYPCWNFTTGSSINKYKGKRHKFFHKPVFSKLYWWDEMQRVYMQPTVTIFRHSPIHFCPLRPIFFEVPHFYSPRVDEGLNTEGVIRLEGLCNRTGNVCFVWHTRMTSIDLNF